MTIRQDVAALQERVTALEGLLLDVVTHCAECRRPCPSRARKFCSARCRNTATKRAYRQRRRAREASDALAPEKKEPAAVAHDP